MASHGVGRARAAPLCQLDGLCDVDAESFPQEQESIFPPCLRPPPFHEEARQSQLRYCRLYVRGAEQPNDGSPHPPSSRGKQQVFQERTSRDAMTKIRQAARRSAHPRWPAVLGRQPYFAESPRPMHEEKRLLLVERPCPPPDDGRAQFHVVDCKQRRDYARAQDFAPIGRREIRQKPLDDCFQLL